MAELQGTVRQKQREFKIELIAVFAILVSLGFPGNFEYVYGEQLGTVIEYTAFFLEIFVMLFSSGNSWMDIRVVNLEKKYAVLYLFIIVTYAVSMLVTRYPYLQVITCTRLAVTLFFAIWLQQRFRWKRLLELICMAQVLFILFSLYCALRYPGLAFVSGTHFTDAFRGLYTTKNTCAGELVFGILITMVLIHEKRKSREKYLGWIILCAIQIVLLFMCQATGALFCWILVSLLLFIPSRVRMPLGWLFVAGSVIFLFAVLTLMPAFEWFFEAIGKDATLTGRIPLWNQIIDVMLENNTFTGFGYGMFWRDPEAYTLVQQGFDEYSSARRMTSGAHNMVMEYWVNNGLIGIAVFFFTILYSMRRVEELPENEYLFCFLIMSYLMISGFTERWMGNYDYKTVIFLILLALCCRRTDEKNREIKNGKRKRDVRMD